MIWQKQKSAVRKAYEKRKFLLRPKKTREIRRRLTKTPVGNFKLSLASGGWLWAFAYFNKEDGRFVEEFKLRVIYIPANPPLLFLKDLKMGIRIHLLKM
ncbi:hypothetical protein DITRI_Ditri19aG0105300 [Diplodiscus trichospermus]